MRSATVPGFRVVWIAVFVVLVLMLSVASVAHAQTPFDHQYGSSTASAGVSEWGGRIASTFSGVLPETGGVSFLVLGVLLTSAGTGLFALHRPWRRSGRRDR